MGELNEAKKFKDMVKNPQNYKRNFEMFFIIDRDNFDMKILDELNVLSPQLAPLKVTLIFIEALQALVQKTWSDIESALVNLLKDE
jgi:DNA polymerase sigma